MLKCFHILFATGVGQHFSSCFWETTDRGIFHYFTSLTRLMLPRNKLFLGLSLAAMQISIPVKFLNGVLL